MKPLHLGISTYKVGDDDVMYSSYQLAKRTIS